MSFMNNNCSQLNVYLWCHFWEKRSWIKELLRVQSAGEKQVKISPCKKTKLTRFKPSGTGDLWLRSLTFRLHSISYHNISRAHTLEAYRCVVFAKVEVLKRPSYLRTTKRCKSRQDQEVEKFGLRFRNVLMKPNTWQIYERSWFFKETPWSVLTKTFSTK